jgi:hypothetical protein
MAAPHVNGEEVIAAAPFRQGGATASYVASKMQFGALVYSLIKLFRKQKAGGLPGKVMLVATPQRLYGLDLGSRADKVKGEAAIWERAALHFGTDQRSGMTALTIESPAEGERATLVGIGVKDDPPSQELMGLSWARRRAPREVAVHRPRGGDCWRHWLVMVGGAAFVIAFSATQGFGLQP